METVSLKLTSGTSEGQMGKGGRDIKTALFVSVSVAFSYPAFSFCTETLIAEPLLTNGSFLILIRVDKLVNKNLVTETFEGEQKCLN